MNPSLFEAHLQLMTAMKEGRIPERGGLAPDFELPDSTGACWRLSERVRNGPQVLLFYRGHW